MMFFESDGGLMWVNHQYCRTFSWDFSPTNGMKNKGIKSKFGEACFVRKSLVNAGLLMGKKHLQMDKFP